MGPDDEGQMLHKRGKIVLDMIEAEDHVLVNSQEVVKNGPFTRFDPKEPKDPNKKSLLDYIIVSRNLLEYINELEVDVDQKWTASRNVKGTLKFPDHYALMLTMTKIPMKKTMSIPPRKEIIWNTRKKNGWERYAKKDGR